jgi:hypothetical protein
LRELQHFGGAAERPMLGYLDERFYLAEIHGEVSAGAIECAYSAYSEV